jgi:hypothetical protein
VVSSMNLPISMCSSVQSLRGRPFEKSSETRFCIVGMATPDANLLDTGLALLAKVQLVLSCLLSDANRAEANLKILATNFTVFWTF